MEVDDKILEGFPDYKNGQSYVGTKEYWRSIFSDEKNRDAKLHEAFGELHTKIVDMVILFCKEHNLDVDAFEVSADGLLGSREYGKWGPCTDSSMAMYSVVKTKDNRPFVDRKTPFLYEI